ncbi:MAG: glycolate oxidase subunit GlcE [Hyphomicrobiales bacterium]|nr:glycolate oxidase subunit GlcE [Hyphomicrobiales bacterium]MDE2116120.1 glycolate oxidase subunit GlcE [Hyphomicrobiales bacterium]
MPPLLPASEIELAHMVRNATGLIDIEGSGTKAGLGRPTQSEVTLSTRLLRGITLYEPSEMVISARAGTPLAEIEASLAEKGQMLPFEPMDYRPLLGSQGEPTLGGVVACNLAGPRRFALGSARDHLIGVRLVNGKGEIVKSGGRVMKNVTGLDLVKLSCGAFGTLGVLSEVTFKVLPRPQSTASLAFHGLDDARAIRALTLAIRSPFSITGAAHVPTEATYIRVEGFESSVAYRIGELRQLLSEFGEAELLVDDIATRLWQRIANAVPLADVKERAIWRVSMKATLAPAFVAAVAGTLDTRHFYDWGGALVWLSVPDEGDAGAHVLRSALPGGHATLVRASLATRAHSDVFQPPGSALLQITRSLKAAFDPLGRLNAGRMYPGI